MRIALVTILLVILLAGAGGLYMRQNAAPATEFKTAKVTRGDLVSTIAATGTLEPEEVIETGAKVSGIIQKFGNDTNGKLIDYRSPVKKAQVLAEIAPPTYESDVKTANAQIKQGEATMAKGNADVATANAKLAQA